MTTQTGMLTPQDEKDSAERIYRLVACASAIIAGTVHAMVAPAHLTESWYVGMFFIVVFAGQFGLALALTTTPAATFLVGAIGANLALVALYVASRTVALPFLPDHDHSAHAAEHLSDGGGASTGVPVSPATSIEPVGLLDLICVGAELILVIMLVGMLQGRARQVVVNLLLGMGLLALAARAAHLLA